MGDPVCQRPAAWWEPPACDTVLCHQSVGSACGRRPGPTTMVPGSSSRDTEAGISLGGTDACLTGSFPGPCHHKKGCHGEEIGAAGASTFVERRRK